MEIQDVFGWVALFVFTALGSWALKRPFGKIGVTGVVFTISVFTLGYGWGMKGAAQRAADSAISTLEVCKSYIDKERGTQLIDIEKCTTARYDVANRIRTIAMPTWAELGSVMISFCSFWYLGHLIVQLATAKPRNVISPKPDDNQQNRAPDQAGQDDS